MRCILVTLLFSSTSLAFAESNSLYSTSTSLVSPVYINLNTGVAKLYNLPTGSWVGTINAGYNFNQALAIEVGDSILPSSQFGSTTVTENVFDVAVKGTLTLSRIFSLYGRFGVGLGTNNWSGSAPITDNCILCSHGLSNTYGIGLAGIGASFKLSPHFDLRVEDFALVPFKNTYTGTVNTVTGGVQYNF